MQQRDALAQNRLLSHMMISACTVFYRFNISLSFIDGNTRHIIKLSKAAEDLLARMSAIEQLPLELWQRILSYLEAQFEWGVLIPLPYSQGAVMDTPMKSLTLVSKILRIRSLPTLFTHIRLRQQFSERKIMKDEDLAFSKFVDFILGSGLQGQKCDIVFSVYVDEGKKGTLSFRSREVSVPFLKRQCFSISVDL